MDRGKWAWVGCTCNGACATVDTTLKACPVGRLDMPPNQLSQIKGVYVKIDGVTVFELHMKCVARSLCEQCHLCFTVDHRYLMGPKTNLALLKATYSWFAS